LASAGPPMAGVLRGGPALASSLVPPYTPEPSIDVGQSTRAPPEVALFRRAKLAKVSPRARGGNTINLPRSVSVLACIAEQPQARTLTLRGGTR
ncbi:MAG: hypothetical protein B7Z73_01910, partial [Planctomycetia bacterium 21-64-5]